MNRRELLRNVALGSGFVCLGSRSPLADRGPAIELRARAAQATLVDTEVPTPVWGYNGSVPGPLLRLEQGDTLHARLLNELPIPTTVHWHGLRLDNAMDGVGNLTQAPVEPGASFDYRFVVPDAGTYWYHPHYRSWEALARGLYGVLIVDERQPPAVNQDLVMVLDDWRLDEEDRLDERSWGSLRDASHAGRLGNVLTVNGHPAPALPVSRGERLRLRLLNASNARVMHLAFDQAFPTLTSLDGQPLASGRETTELTLAPGARADFVLDIDSEPGTEISLLLLTRGGETLAATLNVDSEATAESLSNRPFVLPANPLPDIRPEATAVHYQLLMEGGAMGSLSSALYQGEHRTIRELVAEGQAWSLNGQAGMGEMPLLSVPKGRQVSVEMINDTRWPHAMHFHGHHVRIRTASRFESAGTWRDTVLLDRGERLTVEFVADNPGRWMLHCHMLEHQAAGMATWFEVLEEGQVETGAEHAG